MFTMYYITEQQQYIGMFPTDIFLTELPLFCALSASADGGAYSFWIILLDPEDVHREGTS